MLIYCSSVSVIDPSANFVASIPASDFTSAFTITPVPIAATPVTFPEPSKPAEVHTTSPDAAMVLVAANAVAVADNPVQLAELPVVLWFNVGNEVRLAADPLAGVPNTGVTKVGLVANTNDPLPVSSDIAVANSAEDPVNVLSVKSILLFVNVVVEPAVTVVPADDIIS